MSSWQHIASERPRRDGNLDQNDKENRKLVITYSE
jgi:hypothetical protein